MIASEVQSLPPFMSIVEALTESVWGLSSAERAQGGGTVLKADMGTDSELKQSFSNSLRCPRRELSLCC